MTAQDVQHHSKTRTGEYTIWIEGLPPNFTWRKLKDMARKRAPNVGWTAIEANCRSESKDRRARICVRREHEACNLYDFFKSEPFPDRQLRLYLWLTISAPPELMACNLPGPPLPVDAPESSGVLGPQTPLMPSLNDRVRYPLTSSDQNSISVLRNGEAMLDLTIHAFGTPAAVSSPQAPTLTSTRAADLRVRKQSSGISSSFWNRQVPLLQHKRGTSSPMKETSLLYAYADHRGVLFDIGPGCVPSEYWGVLMDGSSYNVIECPLRGHPTTTVATLEPREFQLKAKVHLRDQRNTRCSTEGAAVDAVKKLNGSEWESESSLVHLGKEKEIRNGVGDRHVRRKSDVVIANGSTSTVGFTY